MRGLLALLAIALAAPVATAHGAASLGAAQPLQLSVSAPRTVIFGDSFTITARAHVEGGVVDPSDVQLEAQVAPLTTLGAPELRRSGDDLVLSQRVACLEAGCVPGKRSPRQLTLSPARATAIAKDGTKLSVRSAPLQLGVATRLSAQELRARSRGYVRQTELPRPRFRLAPALLVALLVACAGVLLALAAHLVREALLPSRKGRNAPREDRLQRALRLVRESVGRPAADRRRALDLLAEVLSSHGESGDDAAEQLAWSRREPSGERVEHLLEQVGGRRIERP